MPKLGPKDRIVLEAAAGWLMLGNTVEALGELEQLSAEARTAPEALMIRWDIQAQREEWEEAIKTADELIGQIDHQPEGYIKRAFALHELKRTEEAWNTLHAASERFGDNWLIPYNLACYASQLGRPADAMKWFRRALRFGNERELREMALNDPDLAPIRPNIEKLKN